MVSRKTVDVAALLMEVNRRNRFSTCSEETRKGWNSMLEFVLHSTGNYAGYGYYGPDKVPDGERPGIRGAAETFATVEERFEGCDDSRRFYYSSRAIGAACDKIRNQKMDSTEVFC